MNRYIRKSKKRKELRQKTELLCENTITQNDATTASEKFRIFKEETIVENASVELKIVVKFLKHETL